MGDPLGGFEPRGALIECFWNFPKFRDELEFLVDEGYMKVTGPETCVWLKNKTSLAEYFRWTGWDAEGISGGFWATAYSVPHVARCPVRGFGNSGGRDSTLNDGSFLDSKTMPCKKNEIKDILSLGI